MSRRGRPAGRPIGPDVAVAGLVVAGVIVAGLAAACTREPTVEAGVAAPVRVEALHGTDLHRVRLSAEAAGRLGVRTAPVRVEPAGGGGAAGGGAARTAIPYAAVLYDRDGGTWVYTNPAPLVFVRHRVTVERIEGRTAVLSLGPAPGTPVVTVGAAELFGAEFGVGE
jgi:hypothetical protein